MHNKIIPRNTGVKNTIKKLFLNFFQALKNNIDIPKPNINENKYEYPIKCTEEDCCKIKVLHKIKKIIGKIIDFKKVSFLDWNNTTKIETIEIKKIPKCDNKQL